MPMMFFYFLKIIFDISTSKRSKRYKPHLILVKKKNLKFAETQVEQQSQTPFHIWRNDNYKWPMERWRDEKFKQVFGM